MKIGKIATWLAVAGIAATAVYLEGGSKLLHGPKKPAPTTAEPAAAKAIAVTVARAATVDLTATLLVTGSLVARDEVLVTPQVEGLRVESLKAEEGTRVKQGEVLATLTRYTLDAQVAQSNAALARSDAAIAQTRAQISQAQARVKESQAAFDRARPLNNSGYLSGATLDQRESAARVADAQLVAANDGLKVAEADRAVLEAQRREIDWKLERTEVRAPIDGVVSRRNARIGAIATGLGEPMFRIVALGEIELDAEIAEQDLPRLAIGQVARVTVAGQPPVEGRIRLLPAEVDKTTRLGRARIFLGDKPALKVGAFARAEIDVDRTRAIAIPSSALLYGSDGSTTVQVVRGDVIETRKVETGLRAGARVAITSGLAEGEVVVEKSGTFLRDGDAVKPILAGEKLSSAGEATR